MTKGGTPHGGLVYDSKLVPVQRRAHRAFQGWRYLDPKDAPPDLTSAGFAEEGDEELALELSRLGLI